MRHAQATHNSDAVVRGDAAYFDPVNADAALDDIGMAQALISRQDIACDVIYCSPLRRCRQTLCTVLPTTNDGIVYLDDRLMEPQGLAVCNRRAERPVVIASSPPNWDFTGVAENNPFDTLKEGYSTAVLAMPEFCDRVRDFMKDLEARHEGQTVLIVGHHDWIRTWFRLFKGALVSPRNCELMIA